MSISDDNSDSSGLETVKTISDDENVVKEKFQTSPKIDDFRQT